MHTRTRRQIIIAGGLAAVLAVTAAVTVMADHGGLVGLFNSRGTIDELKIHDNRQKLKITASGPIDVAIVAAELHAHGQTGWHTHPADSIVTVRPGSPSLEMTELVDGECVKASFEAGQAFVHPAAPHNFVNSGDTALTFGVAYFVPVGAQLLKPVDPAPSC